MSNFYLEFDLQAFEEIDQFALLACQKHNCGNKTDWFGAFRGGLYGCYARIRGVVAHYYAVHAWVPKERLPVETEYHLASLFFNMDSLIECITFALNALGFGTHVSDFRDVTNEKELKKVSPYDIIGRSEISSSQKPLAGYAKIFPSLQDHWLKNKNLLSTIFEQHDVSKHRETIFSGGMARNDPPPGFYESLGIDDDPSKRAPFWPMKEIILRSEPKKPHTERVPQPRKDQVLLEDVVSILKDFIEDSGQYALDNAKDNIELKVKQFEKA